MPAWLRIRRTTLLCVVVMLSVLHVNKVAAVGAVPVDAGWAFRKSQRSCVLEQVTRAGTARFFGEPGLPLRFEYATVSDPFGEGAVMASADAPEWHPAWPSSSDRGALDHVRGGVISTVEPTANQLLEDLEHGRLIRLLGHGLSGREQEIRVVTVVPTRLEESRDAFLACRQWRLPANFKDVEVSQIGFATGQITLTRQDHAKLDRLAEYIRADRLLQGIAIDGHSDSTGDARTNLALSKRRAAMVAVQLVRRGIPRGLLTVNFHGASFPIDARRGFAADALNRRVTVQLKRAVNSDPGGSEIARR